MHRDRNSEHFHWRPDLVIHKQSHFDTNGFDTQIRHLAQMELGVVADLNVFREMQTVKCEDPRFTSSQSNALLVQLLRITFLSSPNMTNVLQHVQEQAALRAIPCKHTFSPMTLQSGNLLVHTEVNNGSVLNSNVTKTTQISMNTRVAQIHALHIKRYAIENLHIHTSK